MKAFSTLIFFFIFFNSDAQVCKIKGVIKDSLGQPIPWVSLQQPQSSNGTTSDANGNFYIDVPKGKMIKSSRLGYGSFAYTVESDAMLEIQLPLEPLLNGSNGSMYQMDKKKGKVIFEVRSHDFIVPPEQIVYMIKKEEEKIEDPNRVFEKIEVPPYFHGGGATLHRVLLTGAKGVKEKGRLQLKFFIEATGLVSNVEVLIPYRKKFDDIVVANLKKHITWESAMQNNRHVGVWCVMDFHVRTWEGKPVLSPYSQRIY